MIQHTQTATTDAKNGTRAALLVRTGRIFYGTGITAYGVQQIVISDFRPEILPPFPAWAHQYAVFPWLTGLALIVVGILVSGLVKIPAATAARICLGLGIYFLLLLLCCHVPYNLLISPNKAVHLGVWAPALKEVAYCGGAGIMAGSYAQAAGANGDMKRPSLFENLIPIGRIFFCTTIILFGYAHFLYTGFISTMVPALFGWPLFWTYFGGAALIGAGIAIIFGSRLAARLLALMIFLWLLVLHIPNAIAYPFLLRGNAIVSAFDALLFCGTAMIISTQRRQK